MKVRLAGGFMSARSGKNGDRIQTYERGRVCEAPGCDTVLSTYNPAVRCSLHAADAVPRPSLWLADQPVVP
jgi:hypothetical protein